MSLPHAENKIIPMSEKEIDLEMQRLPTKDQIDAKAKEPPEEDEDTPSESVVRSHLKRFQDFQATMKHIMEWLRIIIVCGVAIGIVCIVVYNFFASAEKDIPDEVMKKLYKFLEVQATGPNIGAISQPEIWRTTTNSTGN